MKTMCLIPFIMCIIIGCNNKQVDNNQSQPSSVTNLKDTVSVKTDSTIIIENLYLNLDSIKIGDSFIDKNENYGYYRLLFSSCEETQSVYVEKINIIDDGVVKLDKRFKLSSELFGNNIKTSSVEFVSWTTPEIIKIRLNEKLVKFNLTTMTF